MRAALLLGVVLGSLALPRADAAAQAARPDAEAQAPSPAARPFGQGQAVPRMPKTLNEPLGLTLPDRTRMRRAELAPMPDRDIEAPRDRFTDSLSPRVEPMMLPPERQQGATFGREHLRETGPDRPFDNFVPGARLRIPFEGSGGR